MSDGATNRRRVRSGQALVVGSIAGAEQTVMSCCGTGVVADGHSIFEIGSATKALTGVLLAEMVIRGDVRLEDRLSQHLDVPRPAWRFDEPTLLDLATHRSGLPNTPSGFVWRELAYLLGWSERDPWVGIAPDRYESIVSDLSPKRPAGRRVVYSSIGIGLLGDALAQRAGMPYAELLAERVLLPLGMEHSFVELPEGSRNDLLVGHARNGRQRPAFRDPMPAAGAMRSCAEDMMTFLQACLTPPDTVLGRALEMAQSPQVQVGKKLGVGLCWMLRSGAGGEPIAFHSGGTWGFASYIAFERARGRAVVALTNRAWPVDGVAEAALKAAAPVVTAANSPAPTPRRRESR